MEIMALEMESVLFWDVIEMEFMKMSHFEMECFLK